MNDNMNKEQGVTESPLTSSNGQKFCKVCGSHMCYHGHGHFWLRWLLGIVILAMIFCIGVKVGEFKGGYGRGYNGGYNMRSSRQPMMRYNQSGYPGGMMRGYGTNNVQQDSPSLSQPTSTTTPAK